MKRKQVSYFMILLFFSIIIKISAYPGYSNIDYTIFASESIELEGTAIIKGSAATNSIETNAIKIDNYRGGWSADTITEDAYVGPDGDPNDVIDNINRVSGNTGVLENELDYPVIDFIPDTTDKFENLSLRENIDTSTEDIIENSGEYEKIEINREWNSGFWGIGGSYEYFPLNINLSQGDIYIRVKELYIGSDILLTGTNSGNKLHLLVTDELEIEKGININGDGDKKSMTIYYSDDNILDFRGNYNGDLHIKDSDANIHIKNYLFGIYIGSDGIEMNGNIISNGENIVDIRDPNYKGIIYTPKGRVEIRYGGSFSGAVVCKQYYSYQLTSLFNDQEIVEDEEEIEDFVDEYFEDEPVIIEPFEEGILAYKDSVLETEIIESEWSNTGIKEEEESAVYFKWGVDNSISWYEYGFIKKTNFPSDEDNLNFESDKIASSEDIKRQVILEDGKYIFYIRKVVDDGGEIYYGDIEKYEIWIDDTLPDVSEVNLIDVRADLEEDVEWTNGETPEGPTYTLKYKFDIATDNLSGISHYEYGIWTKSGSKVLDWEGIGSEIGVKEKSGLDLIEHDGTDETIYIQRIKAVDKAGNTSEISSDGVKLDITRPIITDIYIRDQDEVYRDDEPNKYYFNENNIYLYIDISEELSGINKIRYGLDSDLDKETLVNLNGGVSSFNRDANHLFIDGISGEKTLFVKLYDRAGNTSIKKSNDDFGKTLIFDNEAPEFKYIAEEDYIGYESITHDGIKILESGTTGSPFEIKDYKNYEPSNVNNPKINFIFNLEDNYDGSDELKMDINGEIKGYDDLFGNFDGNKSFIAQTGGEDIDLNFRITDKAGNISERQYEHIDVTKTPRIIDAYLNIYGKKRHIRYMENIETGEFKKYHFDSDEYKK